MSFSNEKIIFKIVNLYKGCTDLNECVDPASCNSNHTCINTAGSFVCYPNPVDPNVYETPCTDNECDFRADCILNHYSPRGYDCVCKSGYRGNGNSQFRFDLLSNGGPKGCVNIDECEKGGHSCGAAQGCVDTEGSFICINDPYGVCMPGGVYFLLEIIAEVLKTIER